MHACAFQNIAARTDKMNKKPAKVDPSPLEGTITTRAEKKQVEERLAIGCPNSLRKPSGAKGK
jgi:hypothetical protein